MNLRLRLRERLIAPTPRPLRIQFQPPSSKTLGKNPEKRRSPGRHPPRFRFSQTRKHITPRRKIDLNPPPPFPIRRNLQNSRPAQTTMSDQHLLAKRLPVRRGPPLCRHTRQLAISLAVLRAKHQRHQRRGWFHNLQTELLCQLISER